MGWDKAIPKRFAHRHIACPQEVIAGFGASIKAKHQWWGSKWQKKGAILRGFTEGEYDEGSVEEEEEEEEEEEVEVEVGETLRRRKRRRGGGGRRGDDDEKD
ncbi:hypothetical protein PoB_007455400 [Plakobranchus ocellatus]|uniref:Uncharacterized protein n=1 Tax=Plakobranchus ocellatus TaxID=259542 RepID=A0AAV4DV76_9GAST|nr:hypothetical protein PoB_007455400 [Plakobranchus ocellatus]